MKQQNANARRPRPLPWNRPFMQREVSFLLSVLLLLSLSINTSASTVPSEASGRPDVFAINAVCEHILSAIPSDHFGGLYLDDSGNLVVNLSGDDSPGLINKTVTYSNGVQVTYRQVRYSLAKLESLMPLIEPYMVSYRIATIDANDITNTFDVELYRENGALLPLLTDLCRENGIDPTVLRVSVLPEGIVFKAPILYETPSIAGEGSSALAFLNTNRIDQ